MEIILFFLLNDTLFHSELISDNMPLSCQNIFNSIEEMYAFMGHYVSATGRITVTDLGIIKLCDVLKGNNNK